MQESRKLTTIVFAYIAGYSAMMQQDEQQALVVLDLFKTVLETGMEGYQGSIVQFFGDGCLLAFDSTVEALYAATSLQHACSKEGLPVRMGMHLGDVIFKNNNAFGDGVNVASRIESLGVPGAVLMSKTVRDQVRNKGDFVLTSLGQFQFKNITDKMEVFAVANPGFVIPRKEEMRGKLEIPTPPKMSKEEQADWEKHQMLEILDAIEEGTCVLIMGNYAFSRVEKNGEEEREIFLPDLLRREQLKRPGSPPADGEVDYYSSAQSLVNRAGGQRMFRKLADIRLTDLGQIQKERFRLISEIPFDLILSTYPFDLLHDVFQHNQIAHQYDYYSFMKETTEPEPFDMTNPLIYNLFGSMRHKESMVISLDRLYQFLFAVLGARQLPRLIQDKVSQATQLVFLGFSFDDWYMKLLLRVLKVHEKDISYAHPPGQGHIHSFNKNFFESNFQVTFLDRKIDQFVSELHHLCEEEGLLRRKSENMESPYAALSNLVAKYRFEDALDQLDEIMLNNGAAGPLLRELGDHYRSYHKIKEWENYERFDEEELELKWQGLRNRLFELIEKLEAAMPGI
ncbi:MAG: adenylate/guanylate cyclase domain-containing protein [Bacteroidia bacterium]